MAMLHRNAGVWRPNVPCGPKKWARWRETSEASLACENIFVCVMENPSAGNEIGQGGNTTTAEATIANVGSVPGAVGTPLYRQTSAMNYFSAARGLFQRLMSGNQYTLIFKLSDLGANIHASWFCWFAAPGPKLGIAGTNLGPARCIGIGSGGWTPSAAPGTGPVYIGMVKRSGDAKATLFWSVNKPVKLSDIPSDQKILGDFGVYTGWSGLSSSLVLYQDHSSPQTGETVLGKQHYFVLSDLCLLLD